MNPVITHFIRDESGATAIEYGLIGCILSIAIVGALILLAPQVEALYGRISDAVASAP